MAFLANFGARDIASRKVSSPQTQPPENPESRRIDRGSPAPVALVVVVFVVLSVYSFSLFPTFHVK